MESINDDGPTNIRILNLLIILEKKWWLIYEETACYRLRISDLSLNLFHGAMTKKKQFMGKFGTNTNIIKYQASYLMFLNNHGFQKILILILSKP